MWCQEGFRRGHASFAAMAAAGLMACFPLNDALGYGPLVHTLTAYKAKDETRSAFGKWSFQFDNKRLAASMAGALLHDVGYVDGKLELLSNLMHYQGTGSFVDRFLGSAVAGKKWDVVGFGLGLALHYTGDRQGHYFATNRIVAQLSKRKVALVDTLSYEDDKKEHTCVERWLDAIAIADRKLLPEKELTEFLVVLDGLATFVEERESREPGLFDLIREPLSAAIQVTYGVAVPVLVSEVTDQAAYAAIVNAYRVMLKEMAVALRVAEELYGLKIEYWKPRYWPKLEAAAVAQFLKVCGAKRHQVEQLVRDNGWLTDSIDKSTALYKQYVASVERNYRLTGSVRTIWAPDKSPPDVNLDTNLLSAGGEYRLSDESLEDLKKRTGKAVITPQYAKLGSDRSAAYFAKVDLPNLETLVLALDAMEREANGRTAPGRVSPSPLPGQLPEFLFGTTQGKCEGAQPIRLSRVTTIRITKTRVCLPHGARVLDAWIGTLAAAELAAPSSAKQPTDWRRVYRGVCYAYYPRHQASKIGKTVQCLG